MYETQKDLRAANSVLGSGIGGGPRESLSVKMQPVDMSLEMLEKALSAATEELSMLCGRLSSVTSQSPQREKDCSSLQQPVTCAMDSRIVSASMVVNDLIDGIRALRNSLCI